MKKTKYAYMCKVDYDYHIGEDYNPVKMYCNLDSIKHHRKCVSQCGIVKIKIELEEIVQKGDYSNLE